MTNYKIMPGRKAMPIFLIPILLTFNALVGFSQSTPYRFSVNMDQTINGKVFLRYIIGTKMYRDSAVIIEGKASFNGTTPAPRMEAQLRIRSSGKPVQFPAYDILLDPGLTNVQVLPNVLSIVCQGDITQTEYTELQNKLAPINKVVADLDKEYEAAEEKKDTVALDLLLTIKYKNAEKERQAILATFFMDHPASIVSAVKFKDLIGGQEVNLPLIETVYSKLDNTIKELPELKIVSEKIFIAQKTSLGRKAPDFAQRDTSNNPIRFSDLQYQYILIDFWASWCAPCRVENPNLRKLYSVYQKKGFQILSVSLDGNKAAWIQAINHDQMLWLHTSELNAFENSVAKLYGIASIPQNVLIDQGGKIIGKNLKGSALEQKLKELFSKAN